LKAFYLRRRRRKAIVLAQVAKELIEPNSTIFIFFNLATPLTLSFFINSALQG